MSIVEKMDAAYRQMVCARPVGAGDGDTYTVEPPSRERFRMAVLTATGLTEAQLEGLANGDLVILPNPLKARERADAVADRAMFAAQEG